MPAPVGVLIGGPLDGARLSPASRGAFVWCEAARTTNGLVRVRGFAEPGKGRQLYRAAGMTGDDQAWLYAGHSHARCDGCGGMNELGEGERNPRCELCGGALSRPSDLLRG